MGYATSPKQVELALAVLLIYSEVAAKVRLAETIFFKTFEQSTLFLRERAIINKCLTEVILIFVLAYLCLKVWKICCLKAAGLEE